MVLERLSETFFLNQNSQRLNVNIFLVSLVSVTESRDQDKQKTNI